MRVVDRVRNWVRGDSLITELQEQIVVLKQERNAAEALAEKNKGLFDNLNARIATVSQSTELNLRDTSFGARHEQESAIRSIKDVVAQQAMNEVPRMVYLTTKKNEKTGADIVTAMVRFICPR
jgi:hypothetical protein